MTPITCTSLPVYVPLYKLMCICIHVCTLLQQVRDGLDLEDRDEDFPSEEMIERMEERLEEAQGQQKNLFLIIFQVLLFKFTRYL